MGNNSQKISLQGLTGEIRDHQLFRVHYLTNYEEMHEPPVIKVLKVPSCARSEIDHQPVEIKGIGATYCYYETTKSSEERYYDKTPDYLQGAWGSFVTESDWIKDHPKYRKISPDALQSSQYTYKDREQIKKAFQEFDDRDDTPDDDDLLELETLYSAFYKIYGLETVILEPGIQKIGAFSFSRLESVSAVELPETITKIEDAAFSNSPSLKTIRFPSSIKRIGNNVFEHSGIQSFTWPEYRKIPKETFQYSALRHIQLNESVRTIEDEAFRSCKNLAEIQFPDSLKSIGKESFSGCTLLATLHLPDHLSHIGTSAFQDCTSLQEIWLPKSWGEYSAGKEKIVDSSWFAGCSNLRIIHLPRSVLLESLPNPNTQLDYYSDL